MFQAHMTKSRPLLPALLAATTLTGAASEVGVR
jgi:hypothetical protein